MVRGLFSFESERGGWAELLRGRGKRRFFGGGRGGGGAQQKEGDHSLEYESNNAKCFHYH